MPVTVPGPLTLMVRGNGCRPNSTVTTSCSPVGVNVHTEVLNPEHGPDHARNREPTAGVAVSVSDLPSRPTSKPSKNS